MIPCPLCVCVWVCVCVCVCVFYTCMEKKFWNVPFFIRTYIAGLNDILNKPILTMQAYILKSAKKSKKKCTSQAYPYHAGIHSQKYKTKSSKT